MLLLLLAAVALGETPADRALNAAQNLQKYYEKSSGVYQPISWWGSANCMQSIADLQTVCPSCTTNPSQTDVFAATYSAHAKDTKPFIGTYYDDEGWWGLAWVRAYDLTKNKNYLNVAINIFEDMLSTGYNTTCGGIWWKKTEPKKNTSIANALFMSLAAHLANRLTNKSYYYGWAKKGYEWFQTSGVIGADYRVRDGVLTDGCTPSGGYYTYNQGVILGAIVEMNKYSPNSTMMNLAKSIADVSCPCLACRHSANADRIGSNHLVV